MNNMKKNLVLGMRLSLPDFQRNNQVLPFNPELTAAWEDSLKANNYEYELLYVNKGIDGYNLGAIKMFKFLEYLEENRDNLDKVIITDTLDVVFLKEGLFEYMEDNTLYIGDEPTNLGIQWIYENSKALLNKREYLNWLDFNGGNQLLNSGIIGGKVDVVITTLRLICAIIKKNCKNYDEGADMFILNYVAYNLHYNLVHGAPLNTIFKRYDYTNQECFIAHK